MRTLLCLLCLVSNAAAESRVSRVILAEPAQPGGHVMRFATSPTAYLDFPALEPSNNATFTASTPSVAALFADLNNGISNMVTISSPYFSVTEPESYFIAQPANTVPFLAHAVQDFPPGAVDFHSWPVTSINIAGNVITGTGQYGYWMEISGTVPEPPSVALCGVALLCVGLWLRQQHGLSTVE